jgi:hypothetical protein
MCVCVGKRKSRGEEEEEATQEKEQRVYVWAGGESVGESVFATQEQEERVYEAPLEELQETHIQSVS